ncbi:MAG: transporter substrate-binding domain-containing protein [Eubacterium sp.]|nr:transporter substrate-binding domain-containing protein [Eubacterium sp.]
MKTIIAVFGVLVLLLSACAGGGTSTEEPASDEQPAVSESAEKSEQQEADGQQETAEEQETAGQPEAFEPEPITKSSEILAVYSCPAAQIITNDDQTKELADTVIYLYKDFSFVQYVDHDNRYEVYSAGSFELNFDWNDPNREKKTPHILTLNVNQMHADDHELDFTDAVYDVNLDKMTDYCLYPDDIRTDLKLVAAFMQVDKQKFVKQDGSEEYLTTIWFYYDDGSFQQYAILNDEEQVLFSSGEYSVTKDEFMNESLLTIHRTKKYQDGTGLADYDSTHDYVIGELGFIRIYPSESAGDTASIMAGDINKEEFDALIASGPVADESLISASEWATAVKERGILRVGTTVSSMLFSSQEKEDSGIYGFDAGLYQLLAGYIFGDSSNFSIIHVTSPLVSDRTREGVLLDNRADAVFSTYSILPEREEIISFAGPYFTTRQSVLVRAGNTRINGYEDLEGMKVAVQYGTSVVSVVEKYAPGAVCVELNGDDECLQALANGKVDAYVSDFTLLASATIEYPGVFEIRGDLFGPDDNYGVGLPKDSDGVAFVNEFLRTIEEDGTWAKLWKICFGDRIGGTGEIPAPPAIAE